MNSKDLNIIRTLGGLSESYERSSHPDFLFTSELKEKKWSGIRQNELTKEFEFWILGEIRERVTEQQQNLDPDSLRKAHERVFALDSRRTQATLNPALPPHTDIH